MSWIFGIIDNNPNAIDLPNEISQRSLKLIKKEKVHIYLGGTKRTCFHNHQEDNGWAVVGVGISNIFDNYRVLSNDNWNILLENQEDNLTDKIEGHYIIIKWNKDSVSFFTDSLGLRDIYFTVVNGTIFFSTRADWLTMIRKTEIDFREFGSRWLLVNQLSTNSILKGITRISSGSYLKIDLKTLCYNIYHKKFLTNYDNQLPQNHSSVDDISQQLYELIFAASQSQNIISLSLSGGMDSRVLLSFLLKNKNGDIQWNAHTFGDPNHPDSIIAKKITDSLKIKHVQLEKDFPSPINFIKELNDYTGQTIINNASTALLQLSNYELLQGDETTIIIDGGFGEIWRREFFNKLLFSGRNVLISKRYDEILHYLTLFRADIFNEDTKREMHNGCIEQLSNLFDELPPIKDIGIENWADLFAIKTRLPNYYGPEQTRIDNIVCCYMPYIQRPILKHLLTIPINFRKNARLLKKLISNNSKSLSNFSLAKGNIIHPYSLTMLQSRLWKKITQKIGKQYSDKSSQLLLLNMKEYIYDSVNSKDVKETPYYDYKKIKNLVEKYYNGNLSYESQLDWWFSFETFRKIIS